MNKIADEESALMAMASAPFGSAAPPTSRAAVGMSSARVVAVATISSGPGMDGSVASCAEGNITTVSVRDSMGSIESAHARLPSATLSTVGNSHDVVE
jgi:hypothetical protein